VKNSTRKVVILDNITSPYIQQAIIVLNEKAVLSESKVISDAERIVNEYLKRNGYCGNDTTKVYENIQKEEAAKANNNDEEAKDDKDSDVKEAEYEEK